jgi:hypothetical protein
VVVLRRVAVVRRNAAILERNGHRRFNEEAKAYRVRCPAAFVITAPAARWRFAPNETTTRRHDVNPL